MVDKQGNLSFLDSLKQLLELTKKSETIKTRQIFEVLSHKGYPTLLIIFSLPFCMPVQIPGFSTPFGITLCFIGLRIAFAKHPWWPKWILEKSYSSSTLEKLTLKMMKVVEAMQKVLRPRLVFLIKNPVLHRLHGLLICILSVVLALPLPIPMTNMLAALPILALGLGLLEDDGVAIIIGYFLAVVCFGGFIALILLGKSLGHFFTASLFN